MLKNKYLEYIKSILLALLLALVIRTCAFEPFKIPSGSMKPTLLISDYLFVSKYSYGFSKISFPIELSFINGRIFFTEPKRGDVIVFKVPNDKTFYIKRLIGLPGDRVQMKEGSLHINDEPVERFKIGTYTEFDNRLGEDRSYDIYQEKLKNKETKDEVKFNTLQPINPIVNLHPSNTPIYTVPEKHYFFMGDNRYNSRDSRYIDEIGFVPEEYLVGKARIIFWAAKWERIFTTL